MKGVVPSEMPRTWPAEALEGTGRRRALVRAREPGEGRRDFDLFGDGRSQVYGGVAAETPSTTPPSTRRRGQVVLWQEGRRHALLLELGRSHGVGGRGDRARRPLSRLGRRPVRHALAVPRLGPRARSTARSCEGAEAAAPIADLQVDAGRRRAASTTRHRASADARRRPFTGATLRARARAALDLVHRRRSSRCSPPKTVPSAAPLADRLRARCADSVALEAKRAGADWTPAGSCRSAPTARSRRSSRPPSATQYRLSWGAVRAGLAKVAVAARRRGAGRAGRSHGHRPARVAAAPRSSCSSRPARRGRRCRRRPPTRPAPGRSPGRLRPGTYRVRCAPGARCRRRPSRRPSRRP